MKLALVASLSLVVVGSGLVVYLLLSDSGSDSSTATALIATPTSVPVAPAATPFPRIWSDAIASAHGAPPQLIACRDRNGDGVLDGDGVDLAGLSIAIDPGACASATGVADLLETPPADGAGYRCGAAKPPLLIVAVASAGSTLLDSRKHRPD